MCSGALRTYLLEMDALPESPLVAMVPVGLNAKQSQIASSEGGNAVGAVMAQMATDKADPAQRLASIHRSMKDGKEALSSMTPAQILAMSAIGQAPAILTPMLRMQGIIRPPYNVIISNVPAGSGVAFRVIGIVVISRSASFAASPGLGIVGSAAPAAVKCWIVAPPV